MNLKELNRNLRHCVEHPEDWFLFLENMKIKWMDGCSRIFWSSITVSYFQTLFKCKIKISEQLRKKTTAAFCLLSSHKTTLHIRQVTLQRGLTHMLGTTVHADRLHLQQLQLWCIIRQQNKVWSFGGKQFELLAEALLLYWFRASHRKQQT